MISDFGTGWFNLEKRKGQPQSPIPILDSAKRTFAGIHVADMERPIPEADRSKIQAALEKLTFHVMFEMNLPSEKAKCKFTIPVNARPNSYTLSHYFKSRVS